MANTYEDQIRAEATRQGLDPDYAVALSNVESSGNPKAVSKTGAIGLYQMFPDAVKDVGGDYDKMKNDPALQIKYGIAYAKKQYDAAGGDYSKALGYYNQGKAGFERQMKSGNFKPEVTNYINHPAFAPFVSQSAANPVKGLEAGKQGNKFNKGALYRADAAQEPSQADIAATNANPQEQVNQQENLNALTQDTAKSIADEKEEFNRRLKEQQNLDKNRAIQTAAAGAMAIIFGQHQNNTQTSISAPSSGSADYGASTKQVLNRLYSGFTPGGFNNFSNTGG